MSTTHKGQQMESSTSKPQSGHVFDNATPEQLDHAGYTHTAAAMRAATKPLDLAQFDAATNKRVVALFSECKRQREQIAALREALEAVYAVRSDAQNIANKMGERFATSEAVNRYSAAFEQARAALKVSP